MGKQPKPVKIDPEELDGLRRDAAQLSEAKAKLAAAEAATSSAREKLGVEQAASQQHRAKAEALQMRLTASEAARTSADTEVRRSREMGVYSRGVIVSVCAPRPPRWRVAYGSNRAVTTERVSDHNCFLIIFIISIPSAPAPAPPPRPRPRARSSG